MILKEELKKRKYRTINRKDDSFRQIDSKKQEIKNKSNNRNTQRVQALEFSLLELVFCL